MGDSHPASHLQFLRVTLPNPGVQEQLLFIPGIKEGKLEISKKTFQPMTKLEGWAEQRYLFELGE
ncbi:hypothetical protein VN12_25060 [Pirellula sp. SH-Sr6A]|nr:hypothetical protein VN12_25060 [Pirellula sp. SH-Sr6A]